MVYSDKSESSEYTDKPVRLNILTNHSRRNVPTSTGHQNILTSTGRQNILTSTCRQNILTNRSRRNIATSRFVGIFQRHKFVSIFWRPNSSEYSVSDEFCSRNMLSEGRWKFVKMWFIGIRQKVVGNSDEIPTNFCFPMKWYRRPLSSEIRQLVSIPTNFWRKWSSVSACFLVVNIINIQSSLFFIKYEFVIIKN